MIESVTETELITLKYNTERVLEEEPLTAFHPNQSLTLGRDDWPTTAILLGSRGVKVGLRCGWQCLPVALHPHEIVFR